MSAEVAPLLDRRRVTFIAAAVIVGAVAAYVYATGLRTTIVYPTPDEVIIGLQAESLRATGRDRNGRLLPLYIEIPPVAWFHPAAIYSEAAALLIAPFDIQTLRLTTVAVALLNGVLVFLALRAITGQVWAGLFATTALLGAPTHYIHGRLAMDYLYPVPFILAWLWCLAACERGGSRRWLLAAGMTLGVGTYSYASASLLMPMLLALTVINLCYFRSARHGLLAIAGFAMPLIALGLWLLAHPEMVTDSLARYSIYGPATSPAASVFTTSGLGQRLFQYVNYLQPRFLFVDAAGPPLFAVRGWGLLTPAVSVLFVAGLVFIRRWPAPWRGLLIAGLLVAALPATIVDELHATQRVLPMLPFMVAVAGLGAMFLWRLSTPAWGWMLHVLAVASITVGATYLAFIYATQSRTTGSAVPLIGGGLLLLVTAMFPRQLPLGRIVVSVLIVMNTIQFSQFVGAYRADYPNRSRSVLDGNLPGALTQLLERSEPGRTPAIYLNAYINLIDDYWRFMLLTHDRVALAAITTNYRPQDFDAAAIQPGSLVLARREDQQVHAANRLLERLVEVDEPDGQTRFTIYRKRPAVSEGPATRRPD